MNAIDRVVHDVIVCIVVHDAMRVHCPVTCVIIIVHTRELHDLVVEYA